MGNIATVQHLNSALETQLFSLYPPLADVEKNCWIKLINHSQIFNAPPQTIMQTNPGPYDHLLLLIEGNTRAYQSDDTGRELTLYRNHPGDICSVNLLSLFNSHRSRLYFQAETALYGLQLSATAFHKTLLESDIFRKFIFSHLMNSFSDMTCSLQNVVFKKLDARLCLLLKKMFIQSTGNSLKITHQQLANELGTTREVISRSLKQLEKSGCLEITRGKLTMVSPEKLNNHM